MNQIPVEKLMQIIGEQTIQIRLLQEEIQRKINEKNNTADKPDVPVPEKI